MFGIDVMIYCPCCKKLSFKNLGCTRYVKYKDKEYAVVYCNHCDEKLVAKTISIDGRFNRLNNSLREVVDNTSIHVVQKIEEYFINSNFTNETPEEEIEKEVLEYVLSLVGSDFIDKNEYEIKYVIQFFMSHMYNIPSTYPTSYRYEDIKEELIESCVVCW